MVRFKQIVYCTRTFSWLWFNWVMKGVSADADPHYQKLYGRVTDVCSNRRGQPSPSAMKEPRPGRNPSVIRFASPSGKYAVPPISSRTVAEGLKILVVLSTRLCSTSVISHLSITSRSKGQTLSLLGLMAKIKCSICSYQFNIWYAGHRPAHILIWFLAFG